MNKAHLLSLLLACILLSGCQTAKSPSASLWSWNPLRSRKTQPTHGTPTRIVAIWSHDVIHTPGQQATQGFGGRLYFYDANNVAVPVEGQLIVHGYDDSTKRGTPGSRPDKTFVFTPTQLKQHYGQSELGASYSVWIPWQPVGGNQREVSLVPILQATSGNHIVGHQTQNILPGKRYQESTPPGNHPQIARQAGSSNATATSEQAGIASAGYPPGPRHQVAGQPQPVNFTTTTINVPRSMTEQMRHSIPLPSGAMKLSGPPVQAVPQASSPSDYLVPRRPVTNQQAGQITNTQNVGNRGPLQSPRYPVTWTQPGSPLVKPIDRRHDQRPVVTASPGQPVHYGPYRHPVPAASASQ